MKQKNLFHSLLSVVCFPLLGDDLKTKREKKREERRRNLIVGDIVTKSVTTDSCGVCGGVESVSQDCGKKTQREL